MEQDAIKWGFFDGDPESIRGVDHQKFLINEYNKDKPVDKQVNNIAEFIEAIKLEKQN